MALLSPRFPSAEPRYRHLGQQRAPPKQVRAVVPHNTHLAICSSIDPVLHFVCLHHLTSAAMNETDPSFLLASAYARFAMNLCSSPGCIRMLHPSSVFSSHPAREAACPHVLCFVSSNSHLLRCHRTFCRRCIPLGSTCPACQYANCLSLSFSKLCLQ
jgi:hypothetical protein